MAWAVEWWDWMDGAARLRGVDLEHEWCTSDRPDRLLNLVTALVIDAGCGGLASPLEVAFHVVGFTTEAETPPTLDTWGEGREAYEQQQAMMAMIGAPEVPPAE